MASDDARARHSDPVGELSAPDSSHTPRARPISGSAPRPPSSSGVVACADEDFAQDAQATQDTLDERDEPTRVTPDQLIESLREESRADEGSREPATNETGPHHTAKQDVADEDDTLLFVAYESASEPRASWLRRAAPLTGVAALTTLLSLPEYHPAPEPRSVEPESELLKDAASREAAKHRVLVATGHPLESPRPLVEPLALPASVEPPAMIDAEPVLDDDDTLDEPSDGDAHDPLAAQRKWMRALTRAQRELETQAYEAAVVSFERALAYHPSDAQSYGGLGAAQLGRGKWREAVRAYRKAVALSPFEAAFRAGLGRAYEQSGNARLAAKAYGWAQKLDPTVSLK